MSQLPSRIMLEYLLSINVSTSETYRSLPLLQVQVSGMYVSIKCFWNGVLVFAQGVDVEFGVIDGPGCPIWNFDLIDTETTWSC